MTLLNDLRKSTVIIPIEAALRRAETPGELEDAWYGYGADAFTEGSPQYRYLISVYRQQSAIIRKRIIATSALADILAGG